MGDRLDTRELDERRDELLEEEELSRVEDDELSDLESLAHNLGEEEFASGVLLIPEDDFEEYARELAEEIGAVSSDYQWPLGCIDWERAARELAMDYTLVTFRGEDFYVRP